MKKYTFGNVTKDTRAGFDGVTRTTYSLGEKVIARVDAMGIEFTNIRVTERRELEGFAEFVGDAWKECKRLAPKISSTGEIE